jgi:hypothetical protein
MLRNKYPSYHELVCPAISRQLKLAIRNAVLQHPVAFYIYVKLVPNATLTFVFHIVSY